MAGPVLGQDEQQLKRRAMRRLAIALTLIAGAIAALALLDRYNAAQKKPEIPAMPPASQALPPPGERPPVAQSPPLAPPQAPPTVHPPPPPVVSNESEVPLEAPRAAPKASKPAQEPSTAEHKPEAAPAPLQPQVKSPKSAEAPAPVEGVAPKAAPPVESTAAKGYLVQVGVFTTPEHASRLQAKLAEKNIPSFVETRVVVGPFQDRAEADAVNKQLKEMGLQGIVVAPH